MNLLFPIKIDKESATEFYKKLISEVEKIKDLSDLTLMQSCMQNWSNSYFRMKDHMDDLNELMLELRGTELLCDIAVALNAKSFFSSDNVWFPAYYCLNCIWNLTDTSYNIAVRVLEHQNFQNLLIQVINHQPYRNMLKSTNVYYLLKSSISIVHNIARHHGLEITYKRADLKESLVALIRINQQDFMGIVSTLTLSMLVDENELSLLEESKESIRFLLSQITITLMNSSGRCNGFSTWELVNGLRKISVNDNMKKEIVDKNGAKILIKILKNVKSDNLEIEMALCTIWNLCFDKDIRAKLNSTEYQIKNEIKKFEEHPNTSIKKAYNGIIWLLDQNKQNERVKTAVKRQKQHQIDNKWKYDIFISYSWMNKEIVYKIMNELKKTTPDIRIWIDINQMQGSTLEAMANGIEQSRIFLMFASEAYRTSPNCRTEAEYAFSLKQKIIPVIVEFKYKPTGWLGIILGSKTYFEFSERRNFNVSMNSLTNSIQVANATNGSMEDPIQASTSVPLSHDSTDTVGSTSTSNNIPSKIKNWSKSEVEDWLVKSKLPNMKSKLSALPELNGKTICSMIDLANKAPEFLFGSLKTEYQMKFNEILLFNQAIKDLNEE